MIFDTNTYSRMIIDSTPLKEVLASSTRVAIPLPVIAELRSGFLGGIRPVENERALSKFLTQITTMLLIPSMDTTNLYAELQQYARSRGRILSNNDIWIAALAREDGDVLVTFDRGFSVFQDIFGEKLKILS